METSGGTCEVRVEVKDVRDAKHDSRMFRRTGEQCSFDTLVSIDSNRHIFPASLFFFVPLYDHQGCDKSQKQDQMKEKESWHLQINCI